MTPHDHDAFDAFDAFDSRWRASLAGLDTVAPALALDPVHRPAVGAQLGRFRLLRELHRGYGASVYESVEKRSGRTYALKLLAPEAAVHSSSRFDFRREIELANRVAHPSILRAEDWHEDERQIWFVSRFVAGGTLEALVHRTAGTRDEECFVELARRFLDVVEAVELLHRDGVVHRDVCPTNVFVDTCGQFVLADFGSALDATTRPDDSHTCPPGSLRYASPEQIVPGADPLDTSADVYALGLTLHELLTGESAFPDCGSERLRRLKLTQRPPPPRRSNAWIPMGLDAIVRQATEPNRILRHESAAELAGDLERFVSRRRASHRRHHA